VSDNLPANTVRIGNAVLETITQKAPDSANYYVALCMRDLVDYQKALDNAKNGKATLPQDATFALTLFHGSGEDAGEFAAGVLQFTERLKIAAEKEPDGA